MRYEYSDFKDVMGIDKNVPYRYFSNKYLPEVIKEVGAEVITGEGNGYRVIEFIEVTLKWGFVIRRSKMNKRKVLEMFR